jgi:hypothetical protein
MHIIVCTDMHVLFENIYLILNLFCAKKLSFSSGFDSSPHFYTISFYFQKTWNVADSYTIVITLNIARSPYHY